jgi:hypothetical protein
MVGADQIDTDMRDAIVACREALKKNPFVIMTLWFDGTSGWPQVEFTGPTEKALSVLQEGEYPLYLGKS